MDHISETIAEVIGALGPLMLNASEPPKPQASEEEQMRAADAIKHLTGRKPDKLEFRSRDQEPLSDGEPLILDTYVDGKGNEYWIEPHSGTVVQMGPETGRYSPPQPAGSADGLTVVELRERATEIAGRQICDFANLINSLHPLEANDRRAVYFFRWEDLSEPLSETELPPFVQVGLYPNGEMASFADTLSSYREDLPKDTDHITNLPESWSRSKKSKQNKNA